MWLFILTVPAFMALLFFFRFSPVLQFETLILASLLYMSAALLHHWRDKTLTVEIILEYALIAVLALIIFGGLLF